MPIVGYFEGTDPHILSRLTAQGIQTLPLSNGLDMHGKNVAELSNNDEVSVVVGYLHKVIPVKGINLSLKDIIYNCRRNSIPFCVVINEGDDARAEKLLGEFAAFIQFTTPAKMFDKIMAMVDS
jgi:hypothetical protein